VVASCTPSLLESVGHFSDPNHAHAPKVRLVFRELGIWDLQHNRSSWPRHIGLTNSCLLRR